VGMISPLLLSPGTPSRYPSPAVPVFSTCLSRRPPLL
jgi:hypothetical protein